MIAKLLVLAASLAGAWLLRRLFVKLGEQNKELASHRHRAEKVRKKEVEKREADIIDLEQDPETGEFEEKK